MAKFETIVFKNFNENTETTYYARTWSDACSYMLTSSMDLETFGWVDGKDYTIEHGSGAELSEKEEYRLERVSGSNVYKFED